MYGYDYYGYQNTTTSLEGMAVWTIIAFILAIVGCILVYVLFLKPEKKYDNKFVSWLRDFLNFDKMAIEVIIKIGYLFVAIFLTLYSFNFIASNFLSFILILTLGNLIVRVVYESIIMMVMIWKNTADINKKLK